eukprot:TRINITY_DN16581_c0_g1_i1.p1 TRINITY_DN16581_c0_g1~~TRINITY_DN16581_c0_g1_i1.p1  ORF type:complete len:491 (+),score=67.15 TRINITY_DN16581_c0_g1_i1:100-1473(+)
MSRAAALLPRTLRTQAAHLAGLGGAGGSSTWQLAARGNSWISLVSVRCIADHRGANAASARSGPQRVDRIALFIDGDQVGPTSLKQVLEAVSKRGVVTHRQIYLPARSAEAWAKDLEQLGIHPVVVQNVGGGMKDATDIALAWDVGDLPRTVKDVNAIAIASEDTDFIILHKRNKERGMKSYAVLRDMVDDAPSSLAQLLQPVVDDVLWYKRDIQRRQLSTVLVTDFNHLDKEVVIESGELRPNLADEKLVDLASILADLGYLAADQRQERVHPMLLLGSVAKLYHQNQLGKLVVTPLSNGLSDAHDKLRSLDTSRLARSSQDLTLVLPWRKPSATQRKMCGQDSRAPDVISCGGPFLARTDEGLVGRLLERLGYLRLPHELPLEAEAMELFCRLNAKALLARGFRRLSDDAATCDEGSVRRQLHDIFAQQDALQRWRCVAAQRAVRRLLVEHTCWR